MALAPVTMSPPSDFVPVAQELAVLQNRHPQKTPREIQEWGDRSNNFKVAGVLAVVALVFASRWVGNATLFFECLLCVFWLGAIIAGVFYCRKLAANKPRK